MPEKGWNIATRITQLTSTIPNPTAYASFTDRASEVGSGGRVTGAEGDPFVAAVFGPELSALVETESAKSDAVLLLAPMMATTNPVANAMYPPNNAIYPGGVGGGAAVAMPTLMHSPSGSNFSATNPIGSLGPGQQTLPLSPYSFAMPAASSGGGGGQFMAPASSAIPSYSFLPSPNAAVAPLASSNFVPMK